MLVGSAATAAHGAEVIPGDVDVLVRTPQDLKRLAGLMQHLATEKAETQDAAKFLSSSEQPLLIFADGNWTFGRWVIAATRVEVACIREPGQEDRLAETYGEPVWQERQVLEWEGVQIPIVPLEVQMATLLSRQYEGRVQAAARRMLEKGFDRNLLQWAMNDRNVSQEAATRYPEVVRLLSA